MSTVEDEEDKSMEYFRKIQGEDRADSGPERTSTITPEEYRRREREHKQYLRDEENKIKKIGEIMKVSYFYFFFGASGLSIAFIGIFWVLPLFSVSVHTSIFQILLFAPFILIGIAGLIITIIGLVKFFGAQKKIEGSPDW